MKVRSAIAKGRRFQSWIRDQLKALFALDDDDIRCAIGAETGTDIKAPSLPWGIEAKNTEKLNVWQAWQQAKDNAEDIGKTPLLIVKRNRSPVLVVMDFEYWKTTVKPKRIQATRSRKKS